MVIAAPFIFVAVNMCLAFTFVKAHMKKVGVATGNDWDERYCCQRQQIPLKVDLRQSGTYIVAINPVRVRDWCKPVAVLAGPLRVTIRGFFFMGGRTAFVVDGFNLYHSLGEASGSLGLPNETGTKWLDLWGLCRSYIHLFGRDATLVGVHYYSALAHHLEGSKPGVTARHKLYAEVLAASGVEVQFGTFKQKQVKCRKCQKTFTRYEEKETDVAVSVKVLELLHRDVADRVVLVTGDTDVAPAVRTARALFPQAQICFVFPWNRKMKELSAIADQCFAIDKAKYTQHQLPDPFIANGKTFQKPPSW